MRTERVPPSSSAYSDTLLRLLRETDDEFVPPLSARSGTFDDSFEGDAGVERYHADTLDEEYFVALSDRYDDRRAVGFLSFRRDFSKTAIEPYVPATYVVTVAVSPESRGEGYGNALYDALFETAEDPYVATKTWDTNDAHASLLRSRGFEEVKRLVDDRRDGVDTVYFARPTDRKR